MSRSFIELVASKQYWEKVMSHLQTRVTGSSCGNLVSAEALGQSGGPYRGGAGYRDAYGEDDGGGSHRILC